MRLRRDNFLKKSHHLRKQNIARVAAALGLLLRDWDREDFTQQNYEIKQPGKAIDTDSALLYKNWFLNGVC